MSRSVSLAILVISAILVGAGAAAGQSTPPMAQTPSSPTSPAGQVQTSTTPSGNAEKGKELYLKYSCYACHGYDGHGGAGARLVPMRMNLPGFTLYVHNPRQMPPYTSKVLSDAQLADLFAYIKTLPESPAPRSIPLLARIIGEK